MPGRFVSWSIFGGVLALLFGVLFTSQEATKLQAEIYNKLENRFGFTSAIITTNEGGNTSKVVVIYPTENGKFYEAGFREGDRLLEFSKYKFYGLLREKKNSSISIDVVDKNGTPKKIILNMTN
jgi:hypothetical protein